MSDDEAVYDESTSRTSYHRNGTAHELQRNVLRVPVPRPAVVR
jgi:hypothetical protein